MEHLFAFGFLLAALSALCGTVVGLFMAIRAVDAAIRDSAAADATLPPRWGAGLNDLRRGE